MEFVQGQPFEEAIAKLGARSPVGALLSSEGWKDVPVALRERSFFSANVESIRFLQRGQDSISDFLAGARDPATGALKTGSRAAFVQQMQRFAIAEGMGPLKPADKGTIKDITSQGRLELIFDTLTKASHDFGNWKQGMDPAVLNAFPAQKFIRVRRVKKPRSYHQAALGTIRLKTDLAFWISLNPDFGVPWGPWGFGSGCDVEDASRATSEKCGLLKPGQKLTPVERKFNTGLQASLKGLDQPFVDLLKGIFGSQVSVLHDTLYWTDQAAPRAPRPPRPPKPAPPAPPADPWPTDPGQLKIIKTLGGSTGAQLAENPATGERFVVKKGNSPEHVREEFAADQLYRSQGVLVPEARLYDTPAGPVKVARFVEGETLADYLTHATAAERTAAMQQLGQGFAVDALLGNWDVIGLSKDNILIDKNGQAWRIDNGGSLRYRAQGTLKTADQWNEYASELWSLREAKWSAPGTPPNAATNSTFNHLDIFTIARQIEKIDAGVLTSALPTGVDPALHDTLVARLKNLQDIARKALDMEHDHWKAGYTDELTRHMMGLREAGIVDAMPKELNQQPGTTRPKDENGVDFDDMRSRIGGAATAAASDPFYSDILAAAKTLNFHGKSGDFAFNEPKVNAALAHEAALNKLAKSKNATEAAVGKYYLKVLKEIQGAAAAAKAGSHVVVKDVKLQTMPAAKAAAPAISLVKRVADYIAAHGGSQATVAAWMDSHSGNSWNPQATAYKAFVLSNRTSPSGNYWWKKSEASCKKQLADLRKISSGDLDASFTVWHAFVQEVLGHVEFRYNDQDRRTVRIIRTEELAIMKNVYKLPVGGKKLTMPRGPNESGSIFNPYSLHGDQVTVQAVPHSQVTGLYFLERTPGLGSGSFLGDNENEFTFVGDGVTFDYLGTLHKTPVPVDGNDDATTWGLDLSHLRP